MLERKNSYLIVLANVSVHMVQGEYGLFRGKWQADYVQGLDGEKRPFQLFDDKDKEVRSRRLKIGRSIIFIGKDGKGRRRKIGQIHSLETQAAYDRYVEQLVGEGKLLTELYGNRRDFNSSLRFEENEEQRNEREKFARKKIEYSQVHRSIIEGIFRVNWDFIY